MDETKQVFVASVSSIESSDLYMTIKTIMFTSPSSNLNGVRCSLDFMSEIVENQSKYIGLPLCMDTKKIAEGRLDKLGHCYDAKTDTFGSTMIGSFYKFEMEHIGNGETALVGYARVMKRNKAICAALSELFLQNKLKFSFEISCKEYSQLEDGTILIDRNDGNTIEGMAVVSFPACPEAVAMELVAEINALDLKEKETETMEEVEKNNVEVVEAAPVIAEEAVAESEKVEPCKEETEEVAEKKNCGSDVEEKEEDPKEDVVPEEEKKEDEELAACGKEEKSCGEDCKEEEPEEENAACGKKENAEIEKIVSEIDELKKQIASLVELTSGFNEVIASMKEEKQEVIAEVEEEKEEVEVKEEKVVAEINPFVDEMNLNANKKYSLLEESAKISNYTLI